MNDSGLTKVEEKLLKRISDLEAINDELIEQLKKADSRITHLEKELRSKKFDSYRIR